jgi:peptide/nickel transport system substrate-binding protein
MKRIISVLVLIVAAAAVVSAQTVKKGPIVDKVYVDVRMSQEIGLKDAAEGKTDIFWEMVTGPTYSALPADSKAKLDAFASPALTYSLLINPTPNKAPYTWKVGEKLQFNPLAITEVRFALNFLINRKQIVDEILGGNGGLMYTMATPGQPGTYKYNLISSKFGFTATGNEKKAIQDINNAIAEASELSALKGKLVKGKQFWEFNGEPVTLRFYIRVDDPNMRLKEGRYIAAQLEKAGLKVERIEVDRSKCNNDIYGDDPGKLQWSLYTEAWGSGGTRAWWDNIVSQMYARWGGYMPGGDNPEFWNYDNFEIDDLSQKAQNGQYVTTDEYWGYALKATELGLADAVRIYLCYSQSYQVANKARFNARMAYGLGDGLNDWSQRTADVKPEKNGQKILRMTQYSAKGSLFMSTWDPIGPDGFNDSYSLAVSQCLWDPGAFQAPNTARDTPLRAVWSNVKKNLAYDAEGNLVGKIQVPATAVLYDSASKSFKPVGAGTTSFSTATYTYKWGAWHNNRPITIADVMYAESFIVEWMTKDGEADKFYDAAYEGGARPLQETLKGIVLNADGTITTYFDFNHADTDFLAANGGLIWVTPYVFGHPVGVSWDVQEALAKMVAEGGKSGTAWSFSSDPAFVEVDVTAPKCLEDIKAKLQGFIGARYVPPQIKRWKTVESAILDYQASIKFIDEHKNAYISNGPFYIANIDANANFMELAAFRNAAYPYASTYWATALKSTNARIDAVNVPTPVAKTRDAFVDVSVSLVSYPAGAARAADATAKVTITLVAPDGEKKYPGAFVKAGQFQVKLPVADLAKLKTGSYTLIVESYVGKEAPAVEVSSLVVF